MLSKVACCVLLLVVGTADALNVVAPLQRCAVAGCDTLRAVSPLMADVKKPPAKAAAKEEEEEVFVPPPARTKIVDDDDEVAPATMSIDEQRAAYKAERESLAKLQASMAPKNPWSVRKVATVHDNSV